MLGNSSTSFLEMHGILFSSLKSKTLRPPSVVVVTNLSNCLYLLLVSIQQMPFRTFDSHRISIARRSNILISPLEYPAHTHLSDLLNEFPNATDQQSLAPFTDSILTTGVVFCRGSHTLTQPSWPPVTISGSKKKTIARNIKHRRKTFLSKHRFCLLGKICKWCSEWNHRFYVIDYRSRC